LSHAPNFEADTWRSLFVTVNDDVDLGPRRSITGVLDLQAYQGEKEAEVKAALKDRAPEHFRLIDFMTFSSVDFDL